ncbi:MAG: hypothetical protein EOO71_28945 [Myxococcaceae bacterium]|nr:MAG: hypothetical protein EOO71_28945 [Myxococcaceae bacterium]
MDDRVAVFLRSEAQRRGYKVFDALVGEIDLEHEEPIRQLCGSVYGVWADISKRTAPASVKMLPDNAGWFPVYWGRDIKPCSRILAHIQNHKGTGNAKLRDAIEIRGRRLIFGAVLAERYRELESHLHSLYPPLLGSAREGKQPRLIRIEK